MAYYFYDIIDQLREMGIYDVILPFILVFAITFAILEKVQIFGDKKNIHIVISLVLGLLFLQNEYLIFILQRFLPNVSIAIIVFMMLILLVGLAAGKEHGHGWSQHMLGFAFIISIIVILIALSYDFIGTGYYGSGPFGFIYDIWYNIDPGMRGLIFFVVIIGVVVFFLKGRSSTNPSKKLGDVLKDLGENIFRKP